MKVEKLRKEKANNVNRNMKTKCIEFYLQRVIFCSNKYFIHN